MKIRHIRGNSSKETSNGVSEGLWLLSKGNKVLYRGSLESLGVAKDYRFSVEARRQIVPSGCLRRTCETC